MIKMCKNPVAFCSEAVAKFLDIVCTSPQVDCTTELLNQVTGTNCCLNETRMPLYYLYSFQSTSMQNIAQLAQSWYLLPFFSPIFFPSKVAAPQAFNRLRPKCN
jgi:hypothetical protein